MDPRRLLPALTAIACACVVLTLGVGWARSASEAGPRDVPTARASSDGGREPAVADDPGGGTARASRPGVVLAAWDARRSAAWAAGDAAALRELYVAGSRAGAADVRLLREYAARGLRVEGLTSQVLALVVVERSPRRLVLRVTDRVVGARAVTDGAAPRPMPVGAPAEREVVLRRVAGEWQVEEALQRGKQEGG